MLGAVVTEVEEDDHVTFLDATVNRVVNDGFDKLIGDALIVGFLDGIHHIIALLADTCSEHVIGYFNAVPVIVAVHGIVATDNGGHCSGTLLAVLYDLANKTFSTLGVGITTVHEAVDVDLFQAILLGDVAQRHEVSKRTVYAACAGQSHDMQGFAVLLGIGVGAHNLRILHD